MRARSAPIENDFVRPAERGAVAGALRARADGSPQRQARPSGGFDRADAGLLQAIQGSSNVAKGLRQKAAARTG